MEITDEMIKKKHKEFNNRIYAALHRTEGSSAQGQFSPAIERLRKIAQQRSQTLKGA